ncbi:MAG: tRNA lysidine(34) synthetase TilS [Akkermansiaceae bacterium]
MSFALSDEFLAQSTRKRWLLAISGGRDSVAMFHRLIDAGYKKLVLCHVNHGLRGAESGQDATFVRRLAKKHDLECAISRVNIRQEAERNNESIELAARRVRYDFFAQCATKYRCPRVLLAHHADDQAETVLFNLLRGSAGLKGMSVQTKRSVRNQILELWRPMLDTSRHTINNYIAERGIRFREDHSNAQPIATRNRLRNEAMPLLAEIMQRDIMTTINRAAAAGKLQQQALSEVLADAELEDPQGRLFLPKFNTLPAALRLIALRDFLTKNNISDIDHDLLVRCERVALHQDTAKTNLPGNRYFRRKEKRLFIQ